MLARSFKTAADLGITEQEHGALVAVLYMLERGEIAAREFNMEKIGYPNLKCKTPGCILGWARAVANLPLFEEKTQGVKELFLYKGRESYLMIVGSGRSVSSIQPEQAAHALSNYLTTGEPNWSEALAS